MNTSLLQNQIFEQVERALADRSQESSWDAALGPRMANNSDGEIEVTKANYRFRFDRQSKPILKDVWSSRSAEVSDLLCSEILPVFQPDLKINDVIWFLKLPDGTTAMLVVGGQWPEQRYITCERLQIEPSIEKNLNCARLSKSALDFANYVFVEFFMSPRGLARSNDDPVFGNRVDKYRQQHGLFIRVDTDLNWPLSIPFDFIIDHPQPPWAGFSRYRFVDWIITGRKFTTAITDRTRIDSAIKNRSDTLVKSRFIVNLYDFWSETAQRHVSEGAALVGQIGDWLKRDGVDIVYINPCLEQTVAVLEDPGTRYLFADFHTENSQWTIPDGGIVDLSSYTRKRGLSHIDLAYIYHCGSTTRAGQRSICEQLLEAGVIRTAGCPLYDNAEFFLCKILHLLADAGGFGPSVWEASILADDDFEALSDRIDRYLRQMGYPTINRNVTIT